jgi:DNA-binding transcriptional ArsR family regulator
MKGGDNKESLGIALLKALQREGGLTTEETTEKISTDSLDSLFMNTTRQRIFVYLCQFPCSDLKSISDNIGVAVPAIRWHLNKLIESEMVVSKRVKKNLVFYPIGMIDEPEIELLTFLNNKAGFKQIFQTILDKGGVTQKEICGILNLQHQLVLWYISQIERFKLIRHVKDGKYIRYYPTDALQQYVDKNKKRREVFKKQILTQLKKDGVFPEMIQIEDNKIVVQIAVGRQKQLLTLYTNPYSSMLKVGKV